MNTTHILQRYLNALPRIEHYSRFTMRNHRSLLGRWIRFCATQRSKDIDKATARDLLAWIEYRQAAQRQVKDATVARDLCILRTFYTWLWREEIIFANPAHALPEFVCHPYSSADYLTVDECFRMLEAVDHKDPLGLRNYTIIALMWSTGLRSRELRMLDWEDVDVEDGHIKVRHAKGRTQRMIFLNERVHKDLTRYRRNTLGPKTGPLFAAIETFNGKQKGLRRLSGGRLGDIVRDAAQRAGITRRIGPHVLRHTFATHMFEAGVDIKDLQQIMGHDDPTETTRYVHITISAAKRLLCGHVCETLHYGKDTP